ncbi:MAG: type II toxin-antitoxin system HicB family antitoxin [Candidatus Liptonbacteria bacterium]|nr:type II toxin-antitoxin system HicB family antitoxin [Candidatus Liptonbacteria bacterium]
MKYLIVLRKSKYGYDAHVPALPGCHSQGDTKREALANLKDAILTYLSMDAEDNEGKTEVRELEVAVP